MEEEVVYALALSCTEGLGVVRVKKLIDTIGSAEKVWLSAKKDLMMIQGIGTYSLKRFPDESLLEKAKNEIDFCQKNRIKIHYYRNENYPELLSHMDDGPIVLFQKGDYDFQNQTLLSLVGTRNITSYGKDQVEKLIQDLKDFPVTIVSGLAYGVDICAHKAALKNDLKTLAVLAHGLNRVYPKSHEKTAEEIIEAGGALLSEFSSFHGIERERFLQRNRIISGLSMATVIAESDIKGGSMSTARYAFGYNREVFAIPGRNNDRFSKGCNHLIRSQQAQLLLDAEDIVDFFKLRTEKKKERQKKMPLDLNETEQKIYALLEGKGRMQIDELAMTLNEPSHKLLSDILGLELAGLVRHLPGKSFELL